MPKQCAFHRCICSPLGRMTACLRYFALMHVRMSHESQCPEMVIIAHNGSGLQKPPHRESKLGKNDSITRAMPSKQ
jgi:hypothetical protein